MRHAQSVEGHTARPGLRRRVAFRLVVGAALVAALVLPAGAQGSDDQFIASLERASDVDRPRLARLLFGLAAALDANRSSVRLTQGAIVVPDTSREAVASLLRRRFAEYERALDALRAGASRLLERPADNVVLYDTLIDGQQACWALDRHDRAVEAYSTPGGIPALSSRETCTKLRRLAFRPGVVDVVRRSVATDVARDDRVVELEAELAALTEELAALEALLDDLHSIDTDE